MKVDCCTESFGPSKEKLVLSLAREVTPLRAIVFLAALVLGVDERTLLDGPNTFWGLSLVES